MHTTDGNESALILIRSHAVEIATETVRRDRLIQRAYADGMASRGELAEAAGVSVYAIDRIVRNGR